jgi:hypothetical protein
VSFAILATGVSAFECPRSSFTSALVYSRRTDFFVLAVFLDFFATCRSIICEARPYYHKIWMTQPIAALRGVFSVIGRPTPKAPPIVNAAERAVINFTESFANAERLFALPGVRRALIAYWAEALADLRQRQAMSVYARYHSYDAVSTLMEYKRASDTPPAPYRALFVRRRRENSGISLSPPLPI